MLWRLLDVLYCKYTAAMKTHTISNVKRALSTVCCKIKIFIEIFPFSKTLPDSWLSIAKKHPRIVKREGPTANLIAKEVRALKKQEEKTLVTKKI